MKKALATILAIVYLSTSMGATVHLHYCMGRLVSWGLTEHAGKNCDFCGMPLKGASGKSTVGMNGCCHEESKQIKNGNDQKTAQEFFQIIKMAPLVAGLPHPVWVDAAVLSPLISHPVSHGPPPATRIPVFLRNRNFRI